MSPAHCFRAALATMLVATACSEEPITSLPAADLETPVDLALAFPRLTAQTLFQGEVVELAPTSGPARDFSEDVPDDDDVSQIYGAGTSVGFTADYAYSNGRHTYTGNLGKVETTARVSFDGAQIGSQFAFQEEYTPFLLDFGSVKEILAEAYVFIDQDCGLRVDGDSNHYAGWQWFLGSTAPNWGPAGMSTQAFPPVSQPACREQEEDADGGYSGGSESGGGEGWVTCWYLVTYDPYSGEIFDVDFLFCDDVGG